MADEKPQKAQPPQRQPRGQHALLNSRDQLGRSDAQALADLTALYKALGRGCSAAG